MDYGKIDIKFDNLEPLMPSYEKMDRKSVVKLLIVSGILGLAALGFDYLSTIFVDLVKEIDWVMDYYYDSVAMQNVVQIVYSLFALLIPFGAAALFIKLFNKDVTLLPFNKPNSTGVLVSSLGLGFIALVISNFVTSVIILVFQGLGFEFEGGSYEAPTTAAEFLLQVLSIAIVPALCEEFAIRGVMLQSLRKYGDTFAIVLSALVFALMHGNFNQAPFAFLMGLVLGYFVVITDSLWTGIAIHCMNNFYALVVTVIGEYTSNIIYFIVVMSINVIGSLLGILAILWLVENKSLDDFKLVKKYKTFRPTLVGVLSPPMLFAIIWLLIECVDNVTFVG